MRGQFGREQAGAEQPDRHLRARARPRRHRLSRDRVVEKGLQLHDVARELVGGVEIAAQGPRRRPVRAGSAAQPQVDPPGVQRLQRAELLGHHERSMVGQHDAPRSDADRRRVRRHVRQRDRRRGRGDARHVVVLGQPEPREAQAVRRLGVSRGLLQGAPHVAALDHGREIKNRESRHPHQIVMRIARSTPCHTGCVWSGFTSGAGSGVDGTSGRGMNSWSSSVGSAIRPAFQSALA